MMIDPEKLQQVRRVVDEQLVELHLQRGVPLTWARTLLANELGFDLYCERLSHWWFATAVSYAEQDKLHVTAIEQSPQAAVTLEVAIRASRHCQAASRELAELAVVCRLLDERVEVQMQAAQAAMLYPPGVVWEPRDVWEPYVEVYWEGEMDRFWTELEAETRSSQKN